MHKNSKKFVFIPEEISGLVKQGSVSSKGSRVVLLKPLLRWWAAVSPDKNPLDVALLKAVTARAAGVESYTQIYSADLGVVERWLEERAGEAEGACEG